jgi:hypothetical protein
MQMVKNATLNYIWWDAQSKAIKKFSSTTKTSIYKYIQNRSACNVVEHRYYKYWSPMSHVCHDILEDHCHLLKCKCCPKRVNLRKKFLADTKDKLITLGTNNDLSRVILAYLRAWLNDKKYPNIKEILPDASKYLSNAINEQQNIGWEQWFRGQISSSWGELYNNDIKTKNDLIQFPSAN